MSVGAVVHRGRWWILIGWVAATAALALLVSPANPRGVREEALLPVEAPSRRAAELLMKYFPSNSGLSEAVVVFERRDGALSLADMEAINRLADRIATPGQEATAEDLAGVTVGDPASIALPISPLTGRLPASNPLISPVGPAGQAALVIVNIPANFITLRSDRIVRHIRGVVAGQPPPAGLTASVTGSSGFGHDYADAAKTSHRRTLRVTLAAVIVILLVVYRSPTAAMIPLGAISLAAVAATKLLILAGRLGLHVGTAESIFAFVLLYGAGVDYSMLLISRFRERLSAGLPPSQAGREALNRSLRAIVVSAVTNVAGLMMLSLASYGVFRTTGPAVAIAIATATLASVTLTPALVGIAGRRLFWPRRAAPAQGGDDTSAVLPQRLRGLWPTIAWVVTRHGRPVLLATVVLLAVPAIEGLRINWVYDTLAAVRPVSPGGVGNASAGIVAAKRHWPVGEVAPLTVLATCDEPLRSDRWTEIQHGLASSLAAVPSVRNVRSLVTPLGTAVPVGTNVAIAAALGERVAREYVSPDGKASRLTVVLDMAPLTLEAMSAMQDVRSALVGQVKSAYPGLEIHLAGATAEMADIRTITRRDFHLIAPLAAGVVFVIVLLLLRDAILAGFMVAGTLLGYLATLGISQWVFTGLLGAVGLDWKVQVFVFVVLMAVGQDYNIFLAARLAEEATALAPVLATRRALIHTGPVISSCGVIMAATLGSLVSGDLALLRQLGFALALGVLIDTFLVRPLLLPAFVALTGRTGRLGRVIH